MGQVLKLSGFDFSGNSLGTCRNEVATPEFICDGMGVGKYLNINDASNSAYDGVMMNRFSTICYRIPTGAKAIIGTTSLIYYNDLHRYSYKSILTNNNVHGVCSIIVLDDYIPTSPDTIIDKSTVTLNTNFIKKPIVIQKYLCAGYGFVGAIALISFNVQDLAGKYFYTAYIREASNYNPGITPGEYTFIDGKIYCDKQDTTKIAIDQPKVFWVYED